MLASFKTRIRLRVCLPVAGLGARGGSHRRHRATAADCAGDEVVVRFNALREVWVRLT